MKTLTINVNTLVDLAATTTEKNSLAAFGLPVFHDAEIQAMMQEEAETKRKESTRAAVREIMTLNEAADDQLRANYEAIRNANRAIAAARDNAKQIALARAYGAETRNYLPLMAVLGLPTPFDSVRRIPQEWLTANAERVLSQFKEQAQAVAKKPVAKKVAVKTPNNGVAGAVKNCIKK